MCLWTLIIIDHWWRYAFVIDVFGCIVNVWKLNRHVSLIIIGVYTPWAPCACRFIIFYIYWIIAWFIFYIWVDCVKMCKHSFNLTCVCVINMIYGVLFASDFATNFYYINVWGVFVNVKYTRVKYLLTIQANYIDFFYIFLLNIFPFRFLAIHANIFHLLF